MKVLQPVVVSLEWWPKQSLYQPFLPGLYHLHVHCIPSSTSLMQKLNSTGPSIEHWATPPVTCLPVDFVTPIPTLWAGSFSWLAIHLTVYRCNSYFVSLPMMLWEISVIGFTKVQVNNNHCFPLVHQASQKATRLVNHEFPFVNPCWLLMITFFIVQRQLLLATCQKCRWWGWDKIL